MEPNEVAAAVLKIIELERGVFDMQAWFEKLDEDGSMLPATVEPGQSLCGTTVCAAGGAAYVAGWTLRYDSGGATIEDRHGNKKYTTVWAEKDGARKLIHEVGTEALGLAPYETFFYEDDETAVNELKRIAGAAYTGDL